MVKMGAAASPAVKDRVIVERAAVVVREGILVGMEEIPVASAVVLAVAMVEKEAGNRAAAMVVWAVNMGGAASPAVKDDQNQSPPALRWQVVVQLSRPNPMAARSC